MRAVRAVWAGWAEGFGHALEACKNFLCLAVSGGSRGVWDLGHWRLVRTFYLKQ